MIETAPSLLSRREALALTLGVAAAPMIVSSALAAPPPVASYTLNPVEISSGVWVVPGAADKITAANGGAIANVLIFDSKDGAILVDSGPSFRYGQELDALTRRLTGKPVVRLYITHQHADHSLGASAFEPSVLYATGGLSAELKANGSAMSDAMYRVVGDKMRGTNVPEPAHVAADGVEDIGGRRLRFLPLSGHTASDLCLFEESSGLLVAGDLVFLDRAPTTPDANLVEWRSSLTRLAEIPHAKLVPGHGPVEPGRRGIDQTRRWLDFVDQTITGHFNRGLEDIEAMAQPIPDWTEAIAVSRYEYQRSVMHLLPRHEAKDLPQVS